MAQPHPYGKAFRAGDLTTLRDLLAEEVVFHSPVISDQAFEGRQSVLTLLEVGVEAIEIERYTHEVAGNGFHISIADARVLGRSIKVTNLLELDAEGKVREIWVMARPLRGVAAIQEAIGSGLMARRGAGLGPVTRVASKPLAGLATFADRFGARIVAALNRESAGR